MGPTYPSAPPPDRDDQERLSLCETLDRVLNTGVVLAGEVVISVAEVDLIYLNFQLLLTSVATAYDLGLPPVRRAAGELEPEPTP
ncbi:MAG TPA: gas vesicle protein [Isosphaeraceae bacterium]|jgi:hypothetical protein